MSTLNTAFKGGIAALALAAVASVPAQAVPQVDPAEAAVIKELETKGYATPSDLAPKSLLVAAADLGGRIVAVGQFGHVVLSDDDGATWRQAESVPTQALLTAVYLADDQVGYAVGHDAVIIKTEDGGETWELKYDDAEAEMPLFSVRFADANNGVAVGAFSTALSTSDGGETWNLQSVIPDPPPPLEGLEYEPHLNALFEGDRKSTRLNSSH